MIGTIGMIGMIDVIALVRVLGGPLASLEAPAWPASAGPAPLLRPAPVQEESSRKWLERRRRLRIGLGVSAGVLGVGAVGLGLFVGLRRCDADESFCEGVPTGAIVTGVVVAGSFISTIVYAVRLTKHNERRPSARRVTFAAGGLSVRF